VLQILNACTHDPTSGHNHNTKTTNKSFASEVEASCFAQWSTPWEWQMSPTQKAVDERKKGTTMVKRKNDGKEATQQHSELQEGDCCYRIRIVEIWKAATAPAIASDTLVHSHTDTFFGGLFYDAVSTSSVDNRITVGWWIGKDLEGSDRGLRNYPLICLEKLRKIMKNIIYNNRWSGEDSNQVSPEYIPTV